MNQEKYNTLLIHLLVVTQSEIQVTRDLLFGYIAENKKLTKDQKEKTAKAFSEKVKERQKEILAQIRLNYEGDLGGIDDLINSAF